MATAPTTDETDTPRSPLQLLVDRAEIIEAVTRVAVAADERDWRGLLSCFADEVEADYTSLNGGQSQRLGAEELVKGWRRVLEGYDATQHALSNHLVRVDHDEAFSQAYVVAKHYLINYQGSDSWTLGGRYEYALARSPAGWKVKKIKLTVRWAEGNQYLPELARRRSEQGLGTVARDFLGHSRD